MASVVAVADEAVVEVPGTTEGSAGGNAASSTPDMMCFGNECWNPDVLMSLVPYVCETGEKLDDDASTVARRVASGDVWTK